VADTSAATTQVFNTPPLSVAALRQSIDETRAAVASGAANVLPPRAEVERMWNEMRAISAREHVGLLAVSTAATLRALGSFATLGRGALSTVKVSGTLFDRHVLDHYARALDEIREKGVYASLAETSGPYIAAVWTNFQPNQSTITEDVISGKLIGNTWHTMRRWLGRVDQPADAPAERSPAPELPPAPHEPPPPDHP
jgi:hypothetical protein